MGYVCNEANKSDIDSAHLKLMITWFLEEPDQYHAVSTFAVLEAIQLRQIKLLFRKKGNPLPPINRTNQGTVVLIVSG